MTYTLGIAVDVIVDMGCVCYAVECLIINYWIIIVIN